MATMVLFSGVMMATYIWRENVGLNAVERKIESVGDGWGQNSNVFWTTNLVAEDSADGGRG
jgi:hypothetical protein